jgi:hypothetical protein
MSYLTDRWTSESLTARLRAQDAINDAPRRIASTAAAERLTLIRIIDELQTGKISADVAARDFDDIPERIRLASATREKVPA